MIANIHLCTLKGYADCEHRAKILNIDEPIVEIGICNLRVESIAMESHTRRVIHQVGKCQYQKSGTVGDHEN